MALKVSIKQEEWVVVEQNGKPILRLKYRRGKYREFELNTLIFDNPAGDLLIMRDSLPDEKKQQIRDKFLETRRPGYENSETL